MQTAPTPQKMYTCRQERENTDTFPPLFREIATNYFRQWNTLKEMQEKTFQFSKENIATIVGDCYIQGRLEKKIPDEKIDTEIRNLKEYLEHKPQEAITKLFTYKG
jgi:hypothetical protein